MTPFHRTCFRWSAALAAAALASSVGCGRRDEHPSKASTAPAQTSAPATAAPKPPAAAKPGALPAGGMPSLPRSTELPPGPPIGISLTTTGPVDHATVLASGVPFPRGQLTALAPLRVESPGGSVVPAQFTPLAQWPDGSYKAVLVTTPIDASPVPQTFMLRSDPANPVPPPATPLKVEQRDDGVLVTTGPLQFRIGTRGFRLFEQVWVDADKNGQFEPTEALLSDPSELVLIDTAGREYRASGERKPQITVEESGPIRAVIRAAGWLTANDGRSLGAFIVRIMAYAGQDQVRVDCTLVDPREESDVEQHRDKPAFEATGYGLRLPLALSEPAFGLFGGDRGQGYQAYGGPLVDSQHLFQQGAFNYIDGTLKPFTFYYEGVGKGERADGWVDASDERVGVTAMLRNFWQQFPKELAIEQRQLIVWLHPPRATTEEEAEPSGEWSKRYRRPKTFYFNREGGAKTYQLLFVFHRGRGEPEDLRDLYETFQDGPRLAPSTAWLCRSGAFGQLIEAGDETVGYDTHLIRDIWERSIGQRRSTGGLAIPYGWRDFGDRVRPGWAGESHGVRIPSFYDDTHVGAHMFFVQYVRTGDLRWYELAENASRHWMDIDVSHCNRKGYWKKGGKEVGFGPGEGYMIKHEMIDHDSRNIHAGHAHISGLVEYYFLTGDQRAYEVLREVGDWWANAVNVFYPTPVPKPHWAEAERDFSWALYVLNQAYLATNDPKYHQAAAQIVRHLIEWWQQPSDHYVNGKIVGHNDWRQGTGWWYMYPRCDNSPDPPRGTTLYNGTNPWMAGSLLSSVMKFHEADRDLQLVDDKLTEEMFLQATNYVVKYGWNPQKNFFVYSEAGRDTDGGWNHLLYPLAYAWRRVQAGVEHPEWYDTAPQWIEIAGRAWRDAQTVKPRDNTDMGFYGYELVFPADFFAIMHELQPVASDHPARVADARVGGSADRSRQ